MSRVLPKNLKKNRAIRRILFFQSQPPLSAAFRRTADCFWKALHADPPAAVRSAFPMQCTKVASFVHNLDIFYTHFTIFVRKNRRNDNTIFIAPGAGFCYTIVTGKVMTSLPKPFIQHEIQGGIDNEKTTCRSHFPVHGIRIRCTRFCRRKQRLHRLSQGLSGADCSQRKPLMWPLSMPTLKTQRQRLTPTAPLY